MTQDEFFTWAEAQDERYVFDRAQPVVMTGGSINHNQIGLNAHVAMRHRTPAGP